ncbi:MAG: class I SAM-dependent methyltransferase [Thermoleophilia bacterium]|nr:class I SAM-dependent methyltransferase [Thermoleophilia bacterium]
MKTRIAGGAEEDGLVIGNAYDKYGSANPIVRRIMAGFESAMAALVAGADPSSIHEVGCGEGYWVLRWSAGGLSARGSDASPQVIELARENAARENLSPALFEARSIYELEPGRDGADLLVCSEVLEHLDTPEAGLRALQRVVERYLILSVPREPVWRALNLARGSYVSTLGNTPGHVNHWSRKEFLGLASRYFDVVEVRSPLPWTMLLCRPYR